MDALILAGKKETGSLESCHKLSNKALLMINHMPMIEYVVDALKESKEIQNIVVVGPTVDLAYHINKKVNYIVESTDSIIENISVGLDHFENNDKVMVLTSDIPLITGEIIDRFILKCREYDALLYYPFVEKEIILSKYPQAIRSYAILKEGTFCGGNAAIFSKSIFDNNKELLNHLYQNRKDIKKYITLLGMKFIVKYLFKSLTIKEIENRAAQIVGNPVKGIKIEDPEMMIDLDKLSDYELISQVIKGKYSNETG